jgi:hypothetical protein
MRYKTALTVLLIGTAIGSFAMLGDGKGKNPKDKPLLTNHDFTIKKGSFSLKSGYNYRGNRIINPDNSRNYINLNTVVTYNKGNSTVIIPLKKKVYINATGTGIVLHH